MDEKTPRTKLKKIYIEILNGKAFLKKTCIGDVFIKHLDIFDTEEIDEKREDYLNLAKEKGLPTEKTREEEIIKDGDWDQSKDTEIRDLRDYIDGMTRTKSKLILQSEVRRLDAQINESQQKINSLINEKSDLVGFTAENYADKKVNDFYILYTLYKDKDLKNPYFSEDTLDDLTDSELLSISSIYGSSLKKYREENLKRIVLCAFFLNNFHLCENNPISFYGKPIVSLTYYQSDLFALGKYYKHILSEMKSSPTPEQLDDPDTLVGSYNISKNSEKTLQKIKDGSTSTIVGATKEDLKAMGMSEARGDVTDLNKEAAKKGGTLSMQDLIKLSGF